MIHRISGFVEVEGDTLFYKVSGNGKPLLLIAGGGGDGDLYLPLADELANEFKVITYDRRANARSTMNFPNQFDLAQQARDAVAILKATHEDSAIIFGNSSGAIIALEMARLFPNHVMGVIVHEPPIARLHPDHKKWHDFFDDCYQSAFKFGGSSMAATKFMFGIEVPAMQLISSQMKALKYLKTEPKCEKEIRIPSKAASKYLIEQELIPVTDYELDIEFIKDHKNQIHIAVGRYAQEHQTFLYKVADQLCKLTELSMITLPGHHGSFMDDQKAWALALRNIMNSFND